MKTSHLLLTLAAAASAFQIAGCGGDNSGSGSKTAVRIESFAATVEPMTRTQIDAVRIMVDGATYYLQSTLAERTVWYDPTGDRTVYTLPDFAVGDNAYSNSTLTTVAGKVTFRAGASASIAWNNGDRIAVNGFASNAAVLSSPTKAVDFAFSPAVESVDGKFYALSPAALYGSVAGSILTLSVPSTATLPSVDNVAVNPFPNMILGAVSDNLNLLFEPLCGAIEVPVTGENCSVEKVVVGAAGGEPIAGTATVDMGSQSRSLKISANQSSSITLTGSMDFSSKSVVNICLALPAATYRNGFTVAATDSNGKVALTTIEGPVTVERGKIVSVADSNFATPQSDLFTVAGSDDLLSEGDCVAVNGSVSQAVDLSSEPRSAIFESAVKSVAGRYYAAAPARLFDWQGVEMTLALPAECAIDAVPVLAAVASGVSTILQFEPLCGYVDVPVKCAGHSIESITLTALDGSALSGSGAVVFDNNGSPTVDFPTDHNASVSAKGVLATDGKVRFSLPAATYADGFEITVVDSDQYSYSTTIAGPVTVGGSAVETAELDCSLIVPPPTPAFPTADGFGKWATGGRGGRVVEVTNLDDDADGATEGSLRWALKQYSKEPVTIVFRVSGVINLVEALRVQRTAGLTIAGQTAPGDGICVRGGKLNFGGSQNVIIRHIRSRIGITDDNEFIEGGSLGLENGGNFIIDHCTFGWSGEENMTIYDSKNFTIQWCLLHEGLYDSGHGKGQRSYGCQWGGECCTFHHNLLAHNVSRTPRINGARSNDRHVLYDYVNNVNYNWGKRNSAYGGDMEAGSGKYHHVNWINNYYKPGPARNGTQYSYFIQASYHGSQTADQIALWYMNGNYMEGSANTAYNADNYAGLDASYYIEHGIDKSALIAPEPFAVDYDMKIESAQDAYNSVLKGAGAFPRDVVDSRIIEEVRTGTATYGGTYGNGQKLGIIDNQKNVGGYPTYRTYNTVTDSDHDGMDDRWEQQNGFDPTNPDDRNYTYKSGYTALERYLNSLVGEDTPLK